MNLSVILDWLIWFAMAHSNTSILQLSSDYNCKQWSDNFRLNIKKAFYFLKAIQIEKISQTKQFKSQELSKNGLDASQASQKFPPPLSPTST